MSRTVSCPHSGSGHREHYENSLAFRACEEEEKERIRARNLGFSAALDRREGTPALARAFEGKPPIDHVPEGKSGLDRLLELGDKPAIDRMPEVKLDGFISELTPQQKLDALVNPPRPKDSSDGRSFGG
ncbi:hypothetical protein B2J88_49100 [Rhodococcus sp. SRB_17]|nr:hypothetical protein [Rhodococcus sp. SRB_17]